MVKLRTTLVVECSSRTSPAAARAPARADRKERTCKTPIAPLPDMPMIMRSLIFESSPSYLNRDSVTVTAFVLCETMDNRGAEKREEGEREQGAGDEGLRSRSAREFDFEGVDLSGVKKIVGMKVGEKTKKNALSKLLSKDTRLLKLLEGCGQEVSAPGGGAGSQMGLWDSDASVLTSAPNWVELSRAIAAVEQARESPASADSCQGAAVLAKNPHTLGSVYQVAALVHDVTGQSRQEEDTLRIAAIVVHTEQALPEAKARQHDKWQRVRQIEKLESKLREDELGPGYKEVQPANTEWRAGGVETEQEAKNIQGFGASYLGIKTLGSAGRGHGTTSTVGASRRGAGGKTVMSQMPRTIAGLEAKAATDDALTANRLIAQSRTKLPSPPCRIPMSMQPCTSAIQAKETYYSRKRELIYK